MELSFLIILKTKLSFASKIENIIYRFKTKWKLILTFSDKNENKIDFC